MPAPNMNPPNGPRYEIEVMKERFWTGTLNHDRLASVLNQRASAGWVLDRNITAPRRALLIFRRNSYFLIFRKG